MEDMQLEPFSGSKIMVKLHKVSILMLLLTKNVQKAVDLSGFSELLKLQDAKKLSRYLLDAQLL